LKKEQISYSFMSKLYNLYSVGMVGSFFSIIGFEPRLINGGRRLSRIYSSIMCHNQQNTLDLHILRTYHDKRSQSNVQVAKRGCMIDDIFSVN
jgi:hypothetical protein